MVIYCILYCTFILLSSSYLCVFGDDHVIHYMGADDAAEGTSETQHRSRAAWEFYFHNYFSDFVICIVSFLDLEMQLLS